MARKQRRIETPESQEEEEFHTAVSISASPSDNEDSEAQNTGIDKLTVKVLRAMLALNTSSTPIHKQNIRKIALGDDESIPGRFLDQSIVEAQKILRDVYGFTLQELPPKETISAQGKKSVSKSKQWIIVSCLSETYLKFIMESQWLRDSNFLFESELLEERGDYRNSKEERPTLTSDNQLMIQGLALTIVSLIIINNNHMNEDELLTTLSESFGVSKKKPIPVIKMTPEELFKLLDKQEYVNRTVIRNDAEEIIEYRVGRRALIEFDRDSFVEFVRVLYDEQDERAEFIKAVDNSIEAAYGKRMDPLPEQLVGGGGGNDDDE